jgi:hypothetical protein
MSIHDLVNHTTLVPAVPRGVAVAAAAPTPVTTGAFITAQSLISFPVAAGLVTGFWALAKKLLPTYGSSPWAAVVISFVIGMFIFYISISDTRMRLSKSQKVIALGIAVINSLYLVMTALGISTST